MLSTTLRDVVLSSTHDWNLSGGKFNFTSGASGVAQAIDYTLRLHKGELFYDVTKGMPWFARTGVLISEAILGNKTTGQQNAVAAARALILALDGVKSVNTLSTAITNRVLTLNWNVTYSFDDLVSVTTSGTTVVAR